MPGLFQRKLIFQYVRKGRCKIFVKTRHQYFNWNYDFSVYIKICRIHFYLEESCIIRKKQISSKSALAVQHLMHSWSIAP